jgi:hypothetical protein
MQWGWSSDEIYENFGAGKKINPFTEAIDLDDILSA